ncbi:galactitol-1-phosphate 5-dehydrogenase [Virgibacillus salexigens]|uniref:Galactitol-1-phosphate 5-dehydrogenase n=1 Tax=Virgibacillus massiliensis TaxID=1462526 RepID=A0A024Q960_9BACI|nr:galactitol-1-phosphate 5-dehydrogenase [Virgibacillus massiliensis]CDQ38456.1 Galactitol-1-phosphate 5-dehydrogenase [Virgibacillus massiliensis]
MKALKLYAKRDIRYEEEETPRIEQNNEVIIKVKAVGICGSDLSRYKKLGPYVEGMVFGHEFAGEVVETGSAVEEIQVGDRVSGCPTYCCGKCMYCQKGELARCEKLIVIGAKHPGAYAEYVKLPEANVIPIPDGVDFDTAAMIEPSAVVAHGFYRTSLQPGQDVAIMGCGNIGLLAIQWAKVFGARHIYAIDIDEQKLATAKQLGADYIIHSREVPAYQQLHKVTDGLGADIAIEAAGSPVTSAQIFSLIKKGGEVVFMGIPYADVMIERFYFEHIVRNELTVLGSWNAISSPYPGKEWEMAMNFMKNGQLNVKPIISHRIPLIDGPSIFETIIQQQGSFGKVLFYPERVQ